MMRIFFLIVTAIIYLGAEGLKVPVSFQASFKQQIRNPKKKIIRSYCEP